VAQTPMQVVLITGPLGVGKSTLLHELGRRFHEAPHALLDGDAVSFVSPGGLDPRRLDLVENNIASCLFNYREWGAAYVFTSWVFEHQWRLDRFAQRLRRNGMGVFTIALHAAPKVLSERLNGRAIPFASNQEDRAWVNGINARTVLFRNCLHVDTSRRSVHEVADEVAGAVRRWRPYLYAHQ